MSSEVSLTSLDDTVDTSGGDDLVTLLEPVAEGLHLLRRLASGRHMKSQRTKHHQGDHDDETVLLHESRLGVLRGVSSRKGCPGGWFGDKAHMPGGGPLIDLLFT